MVHEGRISYYLWCCWRIDLPTTHCPISAVWGQSLTLNNLSPRPFTKARSVGNQGSWPKECQECVWPGIQGIPVDVRAAGPQ